MEIYSRFHVNMYLSQDVEEQAYRVARVRCFRLLPRFTTHISVHTRKLGHLMNNQFVNQFPTELNSLTEVTHAILFAN